MRYLWSPSLSLRRRIVCSVILFVATAFSSFANTIYVAKYGVDENPGTLEKPYLTIQRAAEVARPGDTVCVRAGTYRETIRPTRSGREDSPIEIVAATNERVVISGADVYDLHWRKHKRDIYRAETDLSFDQLFVDGRMMNEARWPNAQIDDLVRMPRAEADADSNVLTIFDDDLPRGDWEGARVHITPGHEWVSFTRLVKNYKAGNRFDFDRPLEGSNINEHMIPEEGNDYYLFGTLTALDIPGEWFLDKEHHRLYLWAPNGGNPATHRIEIKRRDYAFDLSGRSYTNIRDFVIFGSAINCDRSNHVTVDSCIIKYSHHATAADGYRTDPNGMNVVNGTGNLWKNTVIHQSAGEGLRVRGTNNTVRNCVIHDVNYLAGHYAAISIEGKGHNIIRNTLYRSGRSLLMHYNSADCRIEYNLMFGGGYLTDDCGVTYCWNTDGKGTTIAHNWLYNMEGSRKRWTAGIYLDDRSANHIVHHNVIWNVPFVALYMKQTNEAYNNTLLSGEYKQSIETRGDASGALYVNNLCDGRTKFAAASHRNNGNYEIDSNFVPVSGSGAIDAGEEIPPYTDGFRGSAPDIGAYESSGERWIPGARLTIFNVATEDPE